VTTLDENPWWVSFFQGPWGSLQRGGFAPEKTREEADFIVKALELGDGERVLDVPCGEGRHSIELASRGFTVTGIDLNAKAIQAARANTEERGVTVDFREEDMRSLPQDGDFDAAICYGGSFGYFDDEGNLSFVKAVAGALGGKGRLIIDTPAAESLFTQYKERDWQWWDEESRDTRILQERRWDVRTGRIHATWMFIAPNETSSADVSIRIYTCRELCELLRQAGFREFHPIESLTHAPFKMGSRRLSMVAYK
jgi:SAM-dependent methyltransferase